MDHNKDSRKWSDLIPDLLELIFKHLILSDQLRFGCVCKPWLSVAMKKSYPPAPEPPWLMICKADSNKANQYSFYSLLEKKVYKVVNLLKSAASGSVCQGSSQGWLVMACTRTLQFHLLNPFSKVQIRLPHYSTLPLISCMQSSVPGGRKREQGYRFFVGSITRALVCPAGPNCDNSRPIVAVISCFGHVAICRIGDRTWNHHPHLNKSYKDIIFYNEKLYATNNTGTIDIFRIDDALCPHLVDSIDVLRIESIDVPRTETIVKTTYLVESRGALLMVMRYRQNSTGLTTEFKVYKVEHNCCPLRCVRMGSLEDQVLFLGTNSSLSLPVENFPELRGNQIYFTSMHPHSHADFGVFSLETGSIKPFPFPRSNLRLHGPIWVTPTPVLTM